MVALFICSECFSNALTPPAWSGLLDMENRVPDTYTYVT